MMTKIVQKKLSILWHWRFSHLHFVFCVHYDKLLVFIVPFSWIQQNTKKHAHTITDLL